MKKISSYFPILGQMQFSATTGDCTRSTPSATRYMSSTNVIPQIQNLFFKVSLLLQLKRRQTLQKVSKLIPTYS